MSMKAILVLVGTCVVAGTATAVDTVIILPTGASADDVTGSSKVLATWNGSSYDPVQIDVWLRDVGATSRIENWRGFQITLDDAIPTPGCAGNVTRMTGSVAIDTDRSDFLHRGYTHEIAVSDPEGQRGIALSALRSCPCPSLDDEAAYLCTIAYEIAPGSAGTWIVRPRCLHEDACPSTRRCTRTFGTCLSDGDCPRHDILAEEDDYCMLGISPDAETFFSAGNSGSRPAHDVFELEIEIPLGRCCHGSTCLGEWTEEDCAANPAWTWTPGVDCSESCSVCGDGIVEGGEDCEDGNTIDGDGCDSNCTFTGCGNGIVTAGEACDDGNLVNTDDCVDLCVPAACGDGYLWAGHEVCDDGNTSNTDACIEGCVPAVCGDGYVWEGHEDCDDANPYNDDGCLKTCLDPYCGDGIVTEGEVCDDGNSINTDDCTDLCMSAACGDGHVWFGHEVCDDGNTSDTDACLPGCIPATCGDGFVWAEQEGCDDQNTVDGDGCDSNCMVTGCGNGMITGDELCDDGNLVDGDGCSSGCEPDGATVYYVDDDAPPWGDGTTWETAYRRLQNALRVVGPGDDIRVAGGLYTPDRMEGGDIRLGDRSVSFELVPGVPVHGGYAGLAQPDDPDERDVHRYESVLSGDLLGNDRDSLSISGMLDDFWRQDNSHHVVRCDGSSPLFFMSGFTVRGGQADAIGTARDMGAGLYNSGGDLLLADCTFIRNAAINRGGGLGSWGRVDLYRCTFQENLAPVYGGGGLVILDAVATLRKCAFFCNQCLDGVHWTGSGAGMRTTGPAYLTDCIFQGCTIDGRTSSGAAFHGGGAGEDAMTMENCLFAGNRALDVGSQGGGAYISGYQGTLVGCTFADNQASGAGGLLVEFADVSAANCVFWGNGPGGVAGDVEITFSCVEGGHDGLGNIEVDPLFVQRGYWDDGGTATHTDDDRWMAGDWRLVPDSPAIDAGDNVFVATLFDLAGRARVFDGTADGDWVVDLGAYELVAGTCGDGVVDWNEACDDGNTIDEDMCSSACDVACGLVEAVPPMDGTLPRLRNNIIRLYVGGSHCHPQAPKPGDILIQPLLDDGLFGADMSAQLSLTWEDGMLVIREITPAFAHQTWYAVRNVGDWDGVWPFELHLEALVGDVNNDGRALPNDMSLVNSMMPAFALPEDSRFDIQGDGRALPNDLSVMNVYVPSLGVDKPSGH